MSHRSEQGTDDSYEREDGVRADRMLIGKTAALADWQFRKEQKEFKKLVNSLCTRRLQKQHVTAGLCPICPMPARPGGLLCVKHGEVARSWQRGLYAVSKSRGRCACCHRRAALAGRVRCVECAAKMKKRAATRRNRLKAAGLCNCGKRPITPPGSRCDECREHRRNRK